MTAQIVMHRSRMNQTKRYICREWQGDQQWFGLDDATVELQLWSRIAEGKRRD